MPVDLDPFGTPESEAFQSLIDSILSAPVLSLPRRGLPYSIDTDASDYQVGAVLFQTQEDGMRKPLGFWSRSLNPAEKNYSTSEKECLAVVWALQTLRPYLQGETFVVHSDHAALRWLMEIAEPAGRLMRWRLRLGEFDFRIEYKKGLKNTQADALSRLRTLGETTVPLEEEIPCFTMSESDRPSEPKDSLDDFDVSDDILLSLEALRDPRLVPIPEEEFLREQRSDPFCQDIVLRLVRGEGFPCVGPTPYVTDAEGFLFRIANENHQIVVPASLRERVLHLSHFSKLAGHPGGRRLYAFLKRNFYWPAMAVDCYAVSKNCVTCARNRVLLRRNSKPMRLFPSSAPLEFLAIDLLGELIRTPRGNRFLLVITDRFSKLVRTVPLSSISAESVAKAFVTHWVLIYGPPIWLLSDNGKQFTARFFQNVCRILGVENLFTTTYHPQTNGQVERFNRTIISGLRNYIADHPKDWDLYTDMLTYAYNTQVHRITNHAPFELVLSRSPQALVMPPKSVGIPDDTPTLYYQRWRSWLETTISAARSSLAKGQKKYQRNFNARTRIPRNTLGVGSFVFVRKEFFDKENKKHKLAPIADGPYRVVSLTPDTVVLRIGEEDERVSRDRIVEAPQPLDARSAVLESNEGTRETESEATPASGNDTTQATPSPPPHEEEPESGIDGHHAPTRYSEELPVSGIDSNGQLHVEGEPVPVLYYQSPTTGITYDNTAYRGGTLVSVPVDVDDEQSEEPDAGDNHYPLESPRTAEEQPRHEEQAVEPVEYVIQRIVDCGLDEEDNLLHRVRWYGFDAKDDTWEPLEHLPRSHVIRYYRGARYERPSEAELAKCRPG